MNLLDDDKIYLITYGEKVKYSSKRVIKVSHGVGNNSLVNYVLQDDLLDYYINSCHALFDDETKELIIVGTILGGLIFIWAFLHLCFKCDIGY